MGELVARNMKGWFKKINKRKSCCILLVAYVVVLVINGRTNIKEGSVCVHGVDLRSFIKGGLGITFSDLAAISLSKTSPSEFS
jgi:hypothetical protein